MTPCQHCGQPHPPGTPNCPRTGDSMSQPGPVGTRLDRYQVEALLGAGGFGAVYKARHVHTDALVALKVLKRILGTDPGMVERFLREARAAAAVGSDHIVRVLDAGQGPDGTPFLALELLEGVDLKDLATQESPLPPMRVVLLCLQVLDGLEAAHRKGIVHRDMKPANAFVVRKVDDRGTDKDFVKLLDFGISKMHGDGTTSGLTMTGVAMGTPSYMAPEQFFDARSVDARADVYSVAVMMYELLSGRLPLDASSYAELIVKVRTESPPHLAQVAPTVPQPLADAVMVGLAKEKEQRWPSAREFGNALRAAMGLPLPGNTPIPPRATLGAQKVASPAADTPSMMMGKTAAPQRATPMPQQPGKPPTAPPQGQVPAPQPSQPGFSRPPSQGPTPGQPAPPAQGWVVPTGPGTQGQPVPAQGQTPQPGWANSPGPQGQTPQPAWANTPGPAQGWGNPTPGAQGQTPQPAAWGPAGFTPPQQPSPMTPTYQAPPAQASKGGGAMKWVAIIGGSLVGLCCLCLGVGSMADSAQTGQVTPTDPVPAVVPATDPVEPPPALEKVATPDPKPKKKTTPAAVDRAAVDPNGTEIYDSLKLENAAESAANAVLEGSAEDVLEGIPEAEELLDLAAANGLDRSSPKVRKVLESADRLREIKREQKGALTKAQRREVRRLAKDIAKGLGAKGIDAVPDEDPAAGQ